MFSSQEVRVYLVALDLPPIPETRTTSVMYVGLQLSIDLRALHSVLVHVQCCSLLPTLYTVGCQLNRSTLSLTNVNGMRTCNEEEGKGYTDEGLNGSICQSSSC